MHPFPPAKVPGKATWGTSVPQGSDTSLLHQSLSRWSYCFFPPHHLSPCYLRSHHTQQSQAHWFHGTFLCILGVFCFHLLSFSKICVVVMRTSSFQQLLIRRDTILWLQYVKYNSVLLTNVTDYFPDIHCNNQDNTTTLFSCSLHTWIILVVYWKIFRFHNTTAYLPYWTRRFLGISTYNSFV